MHNALVWIEPFQNRSTSGHLLWHRLGPDHNRFERVSNLLSFFLEEFARGKERLCARGGWIKLFGRIDIRLGIEKVRAIVKETYWVASTRTMFVAEKTMSRNKVIWNRGSRCHVGFQGSNFLKVTSNCAARARLVGFMHSHETKETWKSWDFTFLV